MVAALRVSVRSCTDPVRAAGYWCPPGSAFQVATPCALGYFGTSGGASGYTGASCRGACVSTPGNYCPAGSASSVGVPCPASFGCPTMGAPVLCTTPGRWCPAGTPDVTMTSGQPCAAGFYGGAAPYAAASCAGACTQLPGVYCPPGSTSASGVPCPIGSYCTVVDQPPTPCPAGSFGATPGQASAACSGQCLTGFYCPVGSASASAVKCPSGRYADAFGAVNAACAGPCAVGYYCPAASTTATAAACPPGTFGNVTGLATAACSGRCPRGYYCTLGTADPTSSACRGGVYGGATGLSGASCSGPCAAGYYCPPASVTSTAVPCNGSAWYCPAGSEVPVRAADGFYTYPTGGALATLILPCPAGSYCASGEAQPCATGRYGKLLQLGSPDCSGACNAGFYCPPGSLSPSAVPCGGHEFFCPSGAASPTRVSPGYFSLGGAIDGSSHGAQQPCDPGTYCIMGVERLCAAGRYGERAGLSAAECSGICADGYVCPAGSSTNTTEACPLGYWCASGVLTACAAGTFNDARGANSSAWCAACGAGSFSAAINATSPATCALCAPGTTSDAGSAACVECPAGLWADASTGGACMPCAANWFAARPGSAACAPCAPPGGSAPGASACWPGVVAVTAVDTPPVVPGFSEGDLLLVVFSTPTQAPAVGDVAALRALLSLTNGLGACVGGAAWTGGGAVLQLTVTLHGGCGATPATTTLGGALTLSLAGGWLTDSSGLSSPAPRRPTWSWAARGASPRCRSSSPTTRRARRARGRRCARGVRGGPGARGGWWLGGGLTLALLCAG